MSNNALIQQSNVGNIDVNKWNGRCDMEEQTR